METPATLPQYPQESPGQILRVEQRSPQQSQRLCMRTQRIQVAPATHLSAQGPGLSAEALVRQFGSQPKSLKEESRHFTEQWDSAGLLSLQSQANVPHEKL